MQLLFKIQTTASTYTNLSLPNMQLRLLPSHAKDVMQPLAPALQLQLIIEHHVHNTCRVALSSHDPDNNIPSTP